MIRLVNNMVNKLLGGESLDEINQENFTNFCLCNNLTNTNMKKYRIDKDEQNPNCWNQTYLGTCTHEGETKGLIVTISEWVGFTKGELFSEHDINRRDEAVRNFKLIEHKNFRSFESYWHIRICSDSSVRLKNSAECKGLI